VKHDRTKTVSNGVSEAGTLPSPAGWEKTTAVVQGGSSHYEASYSCSRVSGARRLASGCGRNGAHSPSCWVPPGLRLPRGRLAAAVQAGAVLLVGAIGPEVSAVLPAPFSSSQASGSRCTCDAEGVRIGPRPVRLAGANTDLRCRCGWDRKNWSLLSGYPRRWTVGGYKWVHTVGDVAFRTSVRGSFVGGFCSSFLPVGEGLRLSLALRERGSRSWLRSSPGTLNA
jgi:hypothetical protein